MKKQHLIRELKARGARLIRQGGSHEFWESRKGYRFPVPRHNEIDERLAKEIIRQAEK
ncbi:type II toxin-antitoxin system HicA family toxin [Desulfoprunum benzoelyticum]|jgi:predicted RNA binding protein YcfA (HicA-like mRNA interferase family)|uniref:type II toxin-antitoxin system HicA family toxin n=1 Tax=Desulfoprunum benzoelyticum TaxID=1506996 RepID=UPI0016168EAC|nr:type II toxin-antitoxin system HicA family toxin [Desulfoprunum benzoelyticum]